MPTKNTSMYEYTKELSNKLQKCLGDFNKKEIKGDGAFEVIASTEGVDRDGEVIKVDGWNLKNFMKNPVVLFGHNYFGLPVGAVTAIEQKGKELIARGVFAASQLGQEVRRLYDDGILKAVSVGFIPLERDGNTITKAELLEISFVPVPSNADALSLAKVNKIKETIKHLEGETEKKPVGSHEPAKAEKDRAWDGDKATARLRKWASSDDTGNKDTIDWDKYAKGFTWYSAEERENFTSYKLPHHDMIDGEFKTVWRGVVAAMGALLGARGGVDIPEADQKGVYNHLANHYRQFDEEPPELRGYTQYELDKMYPVPSNIVEAEKQGEITEILGFLRDDLTSMIGGAVERIEEITASKSELDSKTEKEGVPKERKAGQVLSQKNMLLIENAIKAFESSIEMLKELLEMTAPKASTIENGKRLVKFLQTMDKALEVAIKESKKFTQ